MRIVHVAHGYPPEVVGGTERYVAAVAARQRATGHDVAVFAGSIEWRERLAVLPAIVDDVPVTRVHRDDLYFDRWDKGFHPMVSDAFDAFLRDERPDVVHLHHWIRLSTDLVEVAAGRGVPAVVTAHDLYPSCPRVFRLKGEGGDEACEEEMGPGPCVPCVPRWRFQGDDEIARRLGVYRDDMRRELALARVVVAPTPGHGAFLRRMLGEVDVRLRTLPHGTLAGTLGSPPRSADGRLRVVAWSHLHPLKGAHVLLDAVARCDARERIAVRWMGEAVDDDYRRRIDSMSEGLDVELTGRFDPTDLPSVTMDVAVLPTLCRESYSFILDEATRLGVPIVAPDAGALRDRATERVALFRRNDAADLARVLDELASDDARLERMRAAPGPELAGLEEHVDELLGACREAIEAGPPEVDRVASTRLRLAEEWRRREDRFREAVRIERWEDVVDEQRRRIEDLEVRLDEVDPDRRRG